MKVTSSLLILGLIAISFSDVNGGWPFSRKTTPRPLLSATTRRSVPVTPARSIPVRPATRPPPPPTKPATRPPPPPTKPATRPPPPPTKPATRPPPPPAKPVTRPTPPVVKPVTRPPPPPAQPVTKPPPTMRPVTQPPPPPVRPTTAAPLVKPVTRPPPAVIVTPKATPRPTPPPRPIVNTPKIVVVPVNTPKPVVVRPVVVPVVVPPTRPINPPTNPINPPQPVASKTKPQDDLTCFFMGNTCNYTTENANAVTFDGVQPTYSNSVAWVKSKITAGDGPYCLKIDSLSTTGKAFGSLNGDILGKTNITVLLKSPDERRARKLYEFVHISRVFAIRRGDPWITIDSSMVRGKRFSISIGLTNEPSSTIALKSLQLINGACPPHQEEPSTAVKDISCNFQRTLSACRWTSQSGAELKFGSFQPKDGVNQAWVMSPQTSGVGPYCLNVKYEEVIQVGSTNLTIELVNDYSKRDVIFKRFQPEDRKFGEVGKRDIYVTIEESALTAASWKIDINLWKSEYGTIRIQSVQLTDGVCASPTPKFEPTTSTPLTRRPATRSPPINPPVYPPVSPTERPPVRPPIRPSTGTEKGVFVCIKSSTSIPSYLKCDGVNDCPNGEDEMSTICDIKCDQSGFYCKRKYSVIANCMPRSSSDMCDGIEDCEDGMDEHSDFCGSSSRTKVCDYSWQFNFCQNSQFCSSYAGKYSDICSCGPTYTGKRCQTRSITTSTGVITTGVGYTSYTYVRRSNTGAIVGGIIGAIILVAIAGFAYYRQRMSRTTINYGFKFTK